MTRPMVDIAALFKPEPGSWGLRGDPLLWREMAASYAGVPLPADLRAMAQSLVDSFERLSGQSLSVSEPIFLRRHAQGGMSSGQVSPPWWREQGMPLLLTRYRELGEH